MDYIRKMFMIRKHHRLNKVTNHPHCENTSIPTQHCDYIMYHIMPRIIMTQHTRPGLVVWFESLLTTLSKLAQKQK